MSFKNCWYFNKNNTHIVPVPSNLVKTPTISSVLWSRHTLGTVVFSTGFNGSQILLDQRPNSKLLNTWSVVFGMLVITTHPGENIPTPSHRIVTNPTANVIIRNTAFIFKTLLWDNWYFTVSKALQCKRMGNKRLQYLFRTLFFFSSVIRYFKILRLYMLLNVNVFKTE